MCHRDLHWDNVVSILKCKVCGSAIDPAVDSRGFGCAHCGTALSGSVRSTAGDSSSGNVDPTGSSRRELLVRIYCRTAIGLIAYILSTGPMYWAIYEAFHDSGSTFLAKLYFPIALACQLSDTICSWFDWYIGLWVY